MHGLDLVTTIERMTVAEQMAATSEEISRDIEAIARIAKETSHGSEESSRASNQTAQVSIELQRVAQGFSLWTTFGFSCAFQFVIDRIH